MICPAETPKGLETPGSWCDVTTNGLIEYIDTQEEEITMIFMTINISANFDPFMCHVSNPLHKKVGRWDGPGKNRLLYGLSKKQATQEPLIRKLQAQVQECYLFYAKHEEIVEEPTYDLYSEAVTVYLKLED
nr:RNA polymerase II second largest subunit [Tanacetum cinerariifolium]